jgi:hypothetical protein
MEEEITHKNDEFYSNCTAYFEFLRHKGKADTTLQCLQFPASKKAEDLRSP